MKLKRVIAWEFLFLLVTLLLLIIVYCCFLTYNIYQKNRIVKFSNELASLNTQHQNFLSRPLEIKNKDISQEKLDNFTDFITTNPHATTKYIYELIPELNNDSVLLQSLADYAATTKVHKYKYKKEQNLKFPEFFIITLSDIDSIKYFQSEIELLKHNEAKSKNHILSSSDTNSYIYKIGLWIFILTFGLRYLFYATKWSILTIKSKE